MNLVNTLVGLKKTRVDWNNFESAKQIVASGKFIHKKVTDYLYTFKTYLVFYITQKTTVNESRLFIERYTQQQLKARRCYLKVSVYGYTISYVLL